MFGAARRNPTDDPGYSTAAKGQQSQAEEAKGSRQFEGADRVLKDEAGRAEVEEQRKQCDEQDLVQVVLEE